jgi:flavorubredoxin
MKKMLKILVGIILFVLILGIAAIGTTAFLVKSNDQQKSQKTEVLQAKDSNIGKALVIYQPSRSDKPNLVAHKFAEALNKKGYEVTLDHPGTYLSSDISEYSVVVFGSTVYMGRLSGALDDYIKSIKDFSNKKLILYSVGGTKGQIIELDNTEKLLGGVKAYNKIKFCSKDEIEKGTYDEWISNIGK